MRVAEFQTVLTLSTLRPGSHTTTLTAGVRYWELLDRLLRENIVDCSRFWECGPEGSTKLFECQACPENNPLCRNQATLFFDQAIQYPYGPVCDWPSNVDCGYDEVTTTAQPTPPSSTMPTASTWAPADQCLPPDGSKEPDCKELASPGQPYYHYHQFSKKIRRNNPLQL